MRPVVVDESDDSDSPSSSDLLLGEVVAEKYEVVSFISRGALAVVYQAVQRPLNRPVVLKVLQPNAAVLEADPSFSERFRREAATYARLTHPNTVTMFEFGEHVHHGQILYYMALEYVQGRTLRQVMKEEGRFSPERVMAIALQILRSLREAHGLGIVHRDLKPRNLMITESEDGERVKVLDFGVAKVSLDPGDTSEDALTRTGTLLGSPHYMAPEQIRVGAVDGRTDIYALGCILYELLAGVPPFRGNGVIETCAAHLTRPVQPLDVVAGRALGVPPELEAIIDRCLEKSPEDRFADVAELSAAIKALRDGVDAISLVRSPPRPPGRAPPRRSSMVWLAAVLLAFSVPTLILALVLTVLLINLGTSPTPGSLAPPAPATTTAPVSPTHWLRSVPVGAEVWSGDDRLGMTPLELTDEVLRDGGSVVLRMPGYGEVAVAAEEIRAGRVEIALPVGPSDTPNPPPRPRPIPAAPAPTGPEPFRPDVRTER